MHAKITLWLVCCYWSLLSAQAQVVSSAPNGTNATGTTEAYWKHVKSLKQRGVTGTSGKLVRYDSPEGQALVVGTPFAEKNDGDNVIISDSTYVFYDIDFKNLRIIVEKGANVSFYNCKFGQDKGMLPGLSPILKAQDAATKLTLRFCDFEGPGNGQSVGAMLLANDSLDEQIGRAAFIDAAYCRTYGHASDGWKLARGTSKYSYFGPTVGSLAAPTVYVDGRSYSEGDYVVTNECKGGGLLSSHVWRANEDTSTKPKFCEKESSEDWQYINPHADFFHVYASEYQLEALGHYINSSVSDPHPDDAQGGVHQIGMNNAIRYDNGTESLRWTAPPVFRGFYVVRDEDRQSNAIDTGLFPKPEPGKDSLWRIEHLRTNAPPKGVIALGNSLFVFDSPRSLDGSVPVEIFKHSKNEKLHENFYKVNEEYFARNGHSSEPTVPEKNTWRIRFSDEGFAPARRDDGSPMEAVIFMVNGQRVLTFAKGDTGPQVADEDLFSVRSVGDDTYALSSTDGTPFYPVRWRGEAELLDDGGSVAENPTGEGDSIRLAEFSRDKAPFDSGAGRKKNQARIPFRATVRNAQNQRVAGTVVEARVVTNGGEPVKTWEAGKADRKDEDWKVIGTTDDQGVVKGNLYTQRHPEYLQREVRIKGNSPVTHQSEHSFGVGHTIIVFAQSNFDQGFKESHNNAPRPPALSEDMVQHYYHKRDRSATNQEKVGSKYIVHWSTGADDDQDVTGWPTAFANVLTQSRPGEKFFVVWHVQEGTAYTDMVNNHGGRLAMVEDTLARYVYADGQDRGGIAGGPWSNNPRREAKQFNEVHFPILFGKYTDGTAVDRPASIPQAGGINYQLEQWIGSWYAIDSLSYSLHDPHQYAVKGVAYNATEYYDPSEKKDKVDFQLQQTESMRKQVRLLPALPHTTDSRGDSIVLPNYLGALNYAIGEFKPETGAFDDTNHPANDTQDGGMMLNALTAHGFLRSAGLTDWPEPKFNRHLRGPDGQWWEWWSTAGPITTTRKHRKEPRPDLPDTGIPGNYPDHYDTLHWTDVVGFQVDGQPAARVKLTDNGRVRIYAPEGDSFANTKEGLARITHGDGGASGHLDNRFDRIAELWKDIAIIHFKGLPGFKEEGEDIDGIALRAQLPPRFVEDAESGTTTDNNDTTAPSVETVQATPTQITVTYSEPVRPRGGGRFIIKNVDGNVTVVDIEATQEGATPGTVEYDGAKVIVRPASPLPAGKYAWRPQDNVLEDVAGNVAQNVKNNYYHPFTISSASARGEASGETMIPGSSSMYPNPSQGAFTVQLPDADGGSVTVRVVSLSGQVLGEVTAQGKRHIPVRVSLPRGTYLVKVVSPNASYVERLIVE